MKKEARVLIVEDDSFSRNWMALLLARDWRTSIVGEVARTEDVLSFYSQRQGDKRKPDLPNFILLHSDLALKATNSLWDQLTRLPGAPAIMLIGETTSPALVHKTPFPGFCGYILKSEIHYSLGWAIALADPAHWVITRSMEPVYLLRHRDACLTILDGNDPAYKITDRDAEIARLAFIFSMERADLSDEIKVTTEWTYGLVSSVYEKLGMEEILTGEVDPANYLCRQFAQIPQVKETIRRASQSKRKADLETLAFHILTMPGIRELDPLNHPMVQSY